MSVPLSTVEQYSRILRDSEEYQQLLQSTREHLTSLTSNASLETYTLKKNAAHNHLEVTIGSKPRIVGYIVSSSFAYRRSCFTPALLPYFIRPQLDRMAAIDRLHDKAGHMIVRHFGQRLPYRLFGALTYRMTTNILGAA